jgi:hypothetical protein
MRFKAVVEVEFDAFNQDSAERRMKDLLAKAELKKFKERNTVVGEITYKRIDVEEDAE